MRSTPGPCARQRWPVRGYFDRYDYHGVYPVPWAGRQSSPVVVSTDYARGSWWGLDGRVTRALPCIRRSPPAASFATTSSRIRAAAPVDGTLPDDAIASSSRVSAAFVQDEIRLHRRILLNLGLRYDSYGGYSKVTPRAALIVTPSAVPGLQASVRDDIPATDVFQPAFYSDGVHDLELRPETIATHELVWEQYVGRWMRMLGLRLHQRRRSPDHAYQ